MRYLCASGLLLYLTFHVEHVRIHEFNLNVEVEPLEPLAGYYDIAWNKTHVKSVSQTQKVTDCSVLENNLLCFESEVQLSQNVYLCVFLCLFFCVCRKQKWEIPFVLVDQNLDDLFFSFFFFKRCLMLGERFI